LSISKRPIPKRLPLALLLTSPLLAGLVAGCAKETEITAVGGSIGQEVQRTSCPAVGVPTYAGDITLFDPPASRDARSIDIVADITDVKAVCNEADATSPTLNSTVSFRVDARRSNAHGARDVVLPYFAVVLHGGTALSSKSISRVSVHFDDGKFTASADGQATGVVNRSEATLPDSVRSRLIRKRNASDADASVDPMADPSVRAAIAKASFDLLVGFQLTQEQLAYNATR